MREQAGRLQNLQVPRGRLPGMLEHARDLARRHLAAVEVQCDQDAAPGRVCQGGEDLFVRVEWQPGITLLHQAILSHDAEYWASAIRSSELYGFRQDRKPADRKKRAPEGPCENRLGS